MSLSSIELWQRIASQKLATPAQCRTWAAEAAQSLSAAEAASGLKILQRLIELERLTKYQAKILAGQSDQPLRRGSWFILRQLKGPLWQNWCEIVKVDAHTADKCSPRWARWINTDELDILSHSAPSLSRGQKLARIQHSNLQLVYPAELEGGSLLVSVAPASGQLLVDSFSAEQPSGEQVLRFVRQIADGLGALHAGGVVHGRVTPDRVYVDGESVKLIVDPLCEITAGSGGVSAGLLGGQMRQFRDEHFFAPEYLAPGYVPTMSSDVFALGCVWWWLLSGSPPVPGQSPQSILVGQAAELPQLPISVDLPPPLARCLKHCLARNLTARFATAVDVCRALDAATRTVKTPRRDVARELQSTSQLQPTTLERAATQQLKESRSSNAIISPIQLAPRVTPRDQRRRRGNKWLIPVVGGCGFMIVLLLVLKISGGLQPSGAQSSGGGTTAAYVPKQVETHVPAAADPRLAFYDIVATSGEQLWAPPGVPAPIPLDLLPAGGQLFCAFRPAELLSSAEKRKLLQEFNDQLAPLLEQLGTLAGQPLENILQVTVACYSPPSTGQFPDLCWRIALSKPVPLSTLKLGWRNTAREQYGDQTLLVASGGPAYYVAEQPLIDAQSVADFSVGPVELMRDVAELHGVAGPLTPHLERLWNVSDRNSDLLLLLSTPYLFTEGRGLLTSSPPRLSDTLKTLLANDTRATLLQMRFAPTWYAEAQVIGPSDSNAGKIKATLENQFRKLPMTVEQWLVSNSPHPYWRALALRFPRMLQTVNDFTRFGVEDGVAVVNAYLPSEAAANILLASWIGLQDNATVAVDSGADKVVAEAAEPLSVDEYLARPIKLSFDQEPIEVALSLIGEEANDQLPPGSPPWRFELDGDAFERAGITRNQPLRDFRNDNQAVRVALTEVARRGNPVTTVTDLADADQKLIWVVTEDPESPGNQRVSLTTRAAATAAGIPLPREFAPRDFAPR